MKKPNKMLTLETKLDILGRLENCESLSTLQGIQHEQVKHISCQEEHKKKLGAPLNGLLEFQPR